jgi:hypothetical protein
MAQPKCVIRANLCSKRFSSSKSKIERPTARSLFCISIRRTSSCRNRTGSRLLPTTPPFRKLWMDIVEKKLGLAATGDDRDLFLALTGAPVVGGEEMEKVRPTRSAVEFFANQNLKSEYHFQRLLPLKAGQPFALPYIGPPDDPKMPNIFMTLKPPLKGPISESDPKAAGPQIGVAVFDSRMGMLDSLSEAYSFDTEYTCDEDKRRKYKVEQKVSVKYTLKRLAPPIAGRIEQAIEAPLKVK